MRSFPSPIFREMICIKKANDENVNAGSEKVTTKRSKYNVGRDEHDLEKRTCDGILFDSVMEMKFYRDVVLPLVRSGEVVRYELQKSYTLQPKFDNGNKIVQPIVYVADFYLEFKDGHTEVIDTKGCADSVAKVKRKMFWYQNPDVVYKWITYAKKYGGWVDWDYVAKARRDAKRKTKATEECKEELKDE